MDSELDDGHGYRSSMRVTLRWARRWGAVLIVAALLVLAAAAALRYGDLIPAGITLASLGAGLPAALSGAKAWQAQAEAREPVSPEAKP